MNRSLCAALSLCFLFAGCSGNGSGGTGSTAVIPPSSQGAGTTSLAGRHFYVGTDAFDGNFNYLSAALRVYDEATGNPVTSVDLKFPRSTGPTSTSISSDGSTVYVTAGVLVDQTTCELLPALTLFDTKTNTIRTQTTTPASLYGGALGPNQLRFYGVGKGPAGMSLFIFDAKSGALLNTIPLPSGSLLPTRVAVNSTGTMAFVMDLNAHSVYKVDLTTDTASVFFQGFINQAWDNVALDNTGAELFLAIQTRTLIFNTSTGAQIGSIGLAPGTTINYDQRESSDGTTLLSANDNNLGTIIALPSRNETTVQDSPNLTQTNVAINSDASVGLFWNGSFDSFNLYAVGLPSGSMLYTASIPAGTVIISAAIQ